MLCRQYTLPPTLSSSCSLPHHLHASLRMKANPNARHTQEAAGCKERKRKTLITKSKNSKCAESKKWQVATKLNKKQNTRSRQGHIWEREYKKRKSSAGLTGRNTGNTRLKWVKKITGEDKRLNTSWVVANWTQVSGGKNRQKTKQRGGNHTDYIHRRIIRDRWG